MRPDGLWWDWRIDETLRVVYEYPRRRRMGPLLVVVLVVLGIAAGIGSYLVARRYLDDRNNTTSTGPSRSASPGGSSTPEADPCPAFTVEAVKAAGRPGKLTRVIYVEASRAGTSGAEAWICRDTDGVLYYQGHSKQGPATAATSDYTILLGTPIKGSVTQNGSTYTATNPSDSGTGSTQYVVSREKLTLIEPSGTQTDYKVDRSSP